MEEDLFLHFENLELSSYINCEWYRARSRTFSIYCINELILDSDYHYKRTVI
jgi:hypothetical protein